VTKRRTSATLPCLIAPTAIASTTHRQAFVNSRGFVNGSALATALILGRVDFSWSRDAGRCFRTLPYALPRVRTFNGGFGSWFREADHETAPTTHMDLDRGSFLRTTDPAPGATWRPRKSSGSANRVQEDEITLLVGTSNEASTEWLTVGSRFDRRVNDGAGLVSPATSSPGPGEPGPTSLLHMLKSALDGPSRVAFNVATASGAGPFDEPQIGIPWPVAGLEKPTDPAPLSP
jgi:hypothetical protein